MSTVLKKTFCKPLLSVRNLCIHFNIKGQGAANKSVPFSHQLEPERLEIENNNMYRIIGIIDGHYIVETPKGFKKVKVTKSNKKNICDEIKIEKL